MAVESPRETCSFVAEGIEARFHRQITLPQGQRHPRSQEVRSMSVKKLLCPDRVRKIEGSFSWIDHRFVTEGFLHDLSMIEILLYFFLIAVSDRHGLSF